jgi:pimeloyl-ACP methyl ester carboxylesterase
MHLKRIVDGIQTSYLDVGDGEPIVALHGIPTSSALFAPLVPRLAGYRLIAPDLLGQGQTEVPPRGSLGFATYLKHLDAFLSDVPPARFHLLVHDFGGVLGMTWAMGNADRVKSIVVLSTTVTPSTRVALLGAANLLIGARGLRHLMPWTLVRSRVLSPELLQNWAGPWTRRRLLRGLDFFSPSRLQQLRERLAGFPRPVLLVWGTNDQVFPLSHAKVLQEMLPLATMVKIPRCGHWSTLDAPEEVAESVTTFCRHVSELPDCPAS